MSLKFFKKVCAITLIATLLSNIISVPAKADSIPSNIDSNITSTYSGNTPSEPTVQQTQEEPTALYELTWNRI